MKTLKIKKFRDVTLPERKHANDAGLDLYLPFDLETEQFWNGDAIPLGIGIELPDGYMAQVIERSSIAKQGIIFAKAPIDAGYRGEIHAIIQHNNEGTIKLEKGTRIAQLVITPIETPSVELVDELGTSERGSGAFGSTGK